MKIIAEWFQTIGNMSITAAFAILIVIAARQLLKRSPRSFSYVLWSVVGFRLICPYSVQSLFSMFNLTLLRRWTKPGNIQVWDTAGIRRSTQAVLQPGTDAMQNVGSAAAGNARPLSPAEGSGIGLTELAAAVWIIGMILFLGYQLMAWMKLKRKLETAIRYEENIYESDRIRVPFVMGIVRPKIYLPFRLQEKEREYILLHERYHIRRRDHLVKIAAAFLLLLHWFNPLVWLAYRLMCSDMEMSCDERVIRTLGEGIKEDYSRSLLGLASGRRDWAAGVLAFGETAVRARIQNVLRFRKPGNRMILTGIAVCAAAALLGCGNSIPAEDTGSRPEDQYELPTAAELLYQARNPYIGDAVSDGKLAELAGIPDLGAYQTELQTSEEPYLMIFHFQNTPRDEEEFDHEMMKKSAILLALIDNAGQIEWTYPASEGAGGDPTRRSCSGADLEVMGIPEIKDFGANQDRIEGLLEYLADLQYQEGEWKAEKGCLAPNGRIFRYKKILTGTHPNAEKESTFIVYTDDENVTFADVTTWLFSSTYPNPADLYAVPVMTEE